MFGTLTVNLSRCLGFKIRISIIHKFINSLRFKRTDKTHLFNFLTLKGSILPTTKTSKAISCLHMPNKVLGMIFNTKIFLTRINKSSLQIEESQSRNTVNPSDKESLLLKTILTLTRTTTSASLRTLIRTFATLFLI